MGKIMLNEIDYSGGNANVIRLTQAEYDALPPTKLTDNNVYMITDANGDGSQFQPVIYSEDEREIGVWIDGKPLYEKVFIASSPISISGSGWIATSFAINSENIVSATLIDPNGNTSGELPVANINGYININPLFSANVKTIILQYTKTTDTAGSGTWTPQGVPAVHYSTDEKVVGTWIDGSILYEKTVEFGTLPNTATKTVPHGITNVDMIFATEAFTFNPTTGNSTYLNMTNDTISSQVQYLVNRNNIEIWAGLDRTEWMGYVTVRYTKSSQGGN